MKLGETLKRPRPSNRIRHHANSRRFKCLCGRVHEWAGGDRPEYVFDCLCGVGHVR